MTNLKVTASELETVSQQLKNGSLDIENRLLTLHSLVQNLINTSWNGVASNQFNELYQQWNLAGKSLQEALDGISLQLSYAAQNYQQTEENIARALQ